MTHFDKDAPLDRHIPNYKPPTRLERLKLLWTYWRLSQHRLFARSIEFRQTIESIHARQQAKRHCPMTFIFDDVQTKETNG